MDTLNLIPQTKTNLQIHWIVRPAPQAYTFEDIHGNLAQEISLAMENSQPEAEATPSVEPEDFEAAYRWFIS